MSTQSQISSSCPLPTYPEHPSGTSSFVPLEFAMSRSWQLCCVGVLLANLLLQPGVCLAQSADTATTAPVSGNATATDNASAPNESTDSSGQTVAPADPFPQAVPVPDGILDGGTGWLNTAQPISLKDLRGKIVVLDFWTYCCINCMHVLPDLKYLEEKYDRQLVVIGVHSAKFDNEKLNDNIRDAILRYEIRHPVVNDSEMLIWRKFGTRAWPTLALVDPEGRYIGSQSGEGNRELFDQVIGKLVEYHRWKGTLDESPLVFGLESDKVEPTPLRYPGKVLADAASQRVFITDTNHNRIIVTSLTGDLLEIIGSGRMGRQDGSFAEASFDHPQGVALVGDTLYVADTENHLLRVVQLTDKSVSTLAGTGVQGQPGRATQGPLLTTSLNSPWSLAHSGGTLYIAMAGPHQIWSHRLGTDQIGVHAGSGREDVINGSLAEAAFAQPSELVADAAGEFLYVVDSEGSAVRKVPTTAAGQVTTVAGTSELPRGQSLFAFGDVDGIGAEARFQHPLGVALSGEQLFVADSYNHKIKVINLTSGQSTTWAGTGQAGRELQPPQFSEPGGLSVADGRLWIADTNNHRVCVADLATQVVTEFVVTGLTAPPPVRSTDMSETAEQDLVAVPLQTVRKSAELVFQVTLSVPDGHQLNALAPVTWEVLSEPGQTAVPLDALGARDEAHVEGQLATFRLPLTAEAAEAVLLLRMSYGYCEKDAKVCRLATAAWKIPVQLTEAAEASDIRLEFPAPPR